MADHLVAVDEVSSGRLVLQPNVETIVSFEQNVGTVQILSDGAASVFYTVDGSTATIDGANTFELPAGVHSVDERDTTNFGDQPTDQVHFISNGAATIRVQLA